jgi:hypothetical protein
MPSIRTLKPCRYKAVTQTHLVLPVVNFTFTGRESVGGREGAGDKRHKSALGPLLISHDLAGTLLESAVVKRTL